MSLIQIVHAYDVKPEIKLEASAYAPSGYVYFLNKDQDFLTFARSMYTAEREKAQWIRKYENLYQGLQYWRERALTK